MTLEEAMKIIDEAEYHVLPQRGFHTVELDGHFTADELRAFIFYMEAIHAPQEEAEEGLRPR